MADEQEPRIVAAVATATGSHEDRSVVGDLRQRVQVLATEKYLAEGGDIYDGPAIIAAKAAALEAIDAELEKGEQSPLELLEALGG